MKKSNLILCILLFLFSNSYGQWYVRKYQVSDINQLSKKQLDESLGKTNGDLLSSGVIAGAGGCICIISAFSAWSFEDPTILEQLIGEKGMSDILTAFGAGLLAGGSIAAIGYMERKAKIKSAIQKNFPLGTSLHILPKIILNNYTATYSLGVSIAYNF